MDFDADFGVACFKIAHGVKQEKVQRRFGGAKLYGTAFLIGLPADFFLRVDKMPVGDFDVGVELFACFGEA